MDFFHSRVVDIKVRIGRDGVLIHFSPSRTSILDIDYAVNEVRKNMTLLMEDKETRNHAKYFCEGYVDDMLMIVYRIRNDQRDPECELAVGLLLFANLIYEIGSLCPEKPVKGSYYYNSFAVEMPEKHVSVRSVETKSLFDVHYPFLNFAKRTHEK